jgi:molecular chaperone DnaK
MSKYHRVIGIDLGTTYSVVAAYDMDRNDVRVIPNKQGEPTTPSVVYVSPQGQVSVGKAAKEKLTRDPAGVIFEAKRLMGDSDGARGKAMARASGRDIDPELVSAHILKELKSCAERMIGEPVHDAVITVPAYFKEPQKNATREAAKIARLNPRAIINEPTAAAIAYGLESGEQQTFIVYDFGGGTFDVSIVRVVDERNVEVLGTGGDARLGGGDIDQKIVQWVLKRMNEQYGQDFSRDEKLVGRLRIEAERVKINLCNEDAPQDFVIANPAPSIEEICCNITPAEFEAMIQPLLERTIEQVNVALASAAKQHKLTLEDVEAFILVGGSSKIPAVSRVLKERFRKAVKSDLNPDEIVALGAARVALNYQPSLAAEIHDGAEVKLDMKAPVPEGVDSTGWKDVVSHTLGVGLVDDLYDPLISKDHVIPHKVVRDGYATAKDNQTSIYVPVYQGDHAKGSQNHLIGQVTINGLTPEPKGAHQFQITFALDGDGIFTGQILHMQTGKIEPITLDRGQGQITERKRLELSQRVAAGHIAAMQEADPMDTLVVQATEMMPALPPERQRELGELLTRLVRARADGDKASQGTSIAALTMLLLRNRN